MEKKIINELNTLEEDDLKDTLIEYLTDSEITVDDLIETCKTGALNIPSAILNTIGIWCGKDDKKNNLAANHEGAFNLYQYAAKMSVPSPSAMGNVALYYFNGLADTGKNLNHALEWCQKAIDNGRVNRIDLKNKILAEQQQIRRKDRSLSRKFQNSFYKDPSCLDNGLYSDINDAITGKIGEIDISGYTSRELVVADYYVNKNLLEPHLSGKNPIIPKEYEIKMFNAALTIKQTPAHGHIGNFLGKNRSFLHGNEYELENLPYSDIIASLNTICQGSADQERGVAQIMLQFIKKGPDFYEPWNGKQKQLKNQGVYLTGNYNVQDITTHQYTIVLSDAKKVKFEIEENHLRKLQSICYITCIKEISRRLASDQYYDRNSIHYGKDLSFSIALIRALKLVEKGIITLAQVFSEDAQYGVMTGEGITKFGADGLKSTKNKFNDLNRVYMTHLYDHKKSVVQNFKEGITEFDPTFSDSGSGSDSDQDCWSDDDNQGRPKKPKKKMPYLFS